MSWADGSTSSSTSPGSAVESLATRPFTTVRARRGTSVMQINALGTFLTNREAVSQMLEQPLDARGLRGTVVNVGSVLDRSPSPKHFGTLAYAASKGAVRAMTLAAAARYAPDRIRFNSACPRFDRHADGRPRGERRYGFGPTWPPSSRSLVDPETRLTWPKPPFISASRPRGSSPAPS